MMRDAGPILFALLLLASITGLLSLFSSSPKKKQKTSVNELLSIIVAQNEMYLQSMAKQKPEPAFSPGQTLEVFKREGLDTWQRKCLAVVSKPGMSIKTRLFPHYRMYLREIGQAALYEDEAAFDAAMSPWLEKNGIDRIAGTYPGVRIQRDALLDTLRARISDKADDIADD